MTSSWKYAVLNTKYLETDKFYESFHICELYDINGEPAWTGGIKPYGESLDELILCLEHQLKAAKDAKAGVGEIIVE